jgi:hypothetical protein
MKYINSNSFGKFALITTCLALLASCAVEPEKSNPRKLPTDAEVEQYNASVEADERIVCRAERQVRSNIPRRVCRLVRDIEETSAFHREQLGRVLR